MVAVIGVPVQPFADGVIVKVTVTGAEELFVNSPWIFPEPLLAISLQVKVLSLVQVKVVPLKDPVNTIVVISDPDQVVCELGVATAFGAVLTVTMVWLLLLQVPLE